MEIRQESRFHSLGMLIGLWLVSLSSLAPWPMLMIILARHFLIISHLICSLGTTFH
jgi:hypothetical protein